MDSDELSLVPTVAAPPVVLPPTIQSVPLPPEPVEVVNNMPSIFKAVPAGMGVEEVILTTEFKVRILPPAPPASLVTLYKMPEMQVTLEPTFTEAVELPGNQIGNFEV